MRTKNFLLLLLTIIFVILSIFYIISVCNYDMKELFITKYSDTGKNCDILDSIIAQSGKLNENAMYTSEILKNNGYIEDYHTGYSCNNTNYNNQYLAKYKDINNRDLLLAHSCINISPYQIVNTINTYPSLKANSYIITLTEDNKSYVEYGDIEELTRRIDAKIKYTINSTSVANKEINHLYFPIYVIISQAPYLKNSNEDIKVTDSNRGSDGNNYDSCSTNYNVKNSKVCPASFKMRAIVIIIFLGLKSTSEFITSTEDISNTNIVKNNVTTMMTILEANKSISKQCFLKCGTNNHTHACGCLNVLGSYVVDNKVYNSVCLTNNERVDMSMVYFVNPYADTYSNSKYANKPFALNEFRWYTVPPPPPKTST